jgi:hypothetical protein
MRHVEFHPDQLTGQDAAWWTAWLARSNEARRKLLDAIEKGEPFDFKQQVWSDLKAFLLKRVFHDKCAYCEAPVASVSVGDAEHYRPKAKVTRGSKDAPREPASVGGSPHPGYYWLAYHWRNLLPSCEQCNAVHGKMNQFPVTKEYVARPELEPDDLDVQEVPVLLHPYRDRPEKHLAFGLRGIANARDGSGMGEASIRVYNLNREALATQRAEAMELACLRWSKALADRDSDALKNVLKPIRAGTAQFARAQLDAIDAMTELARSAIRADGTDP